MRAYGISTVIDLRSPSELATDVAAPSRVSGVQNLHRPLVDDANMRKLGEAADMLGRYLMMLDHRPHAFRDVFTAVAGADGGVLFHCFAGKDRTGLIAAMLLALAGVPPDHIAQDFTETDKQLARKYERWLAEAEPARRAEMAEELRCPPDRILGVLGHLRRRWGGVAGYLEAAGVPSKSLDRARAKLA